MKTINLTGDVGWEITPDGLRNELPDTGEEVLINVYSYGGSVFDGVELYNVIREYPGKVNVWIGAIAASAASFFPLSADNITVRDNSTMMIHRTWSFAIGDADDMTKEAEILQGLDGIIAEIYAKKSGKKKSKVLSDMKSETWLFGGDDIVAYGLADAVDTAPESESVGDEVSDEYDINEEEIKSEAVAKIDMIKSRLRKSEQYKSDMERAASIIGERRNAFSKLLKPFAIANEDQHENTGPVGDGEPNTTEERMKLSEIFQKDPEAKAEYETAVSQAKADAETEAMAKVGAERDGAVKNENSRMLGILNLAGINMSAEVKAALENGQTEEQYAVAVLKANSGLPKNNADQIKGVAGAKEPQESAKDSADAEANSRQAELDAIDALYGVKKEDK